MSDTFLLDGIDALQATAMPFPGGWELAFRSTHAGLHHQLYVDGELADFTDAPGQRRFHLDSGGPRQIVIAAVDAARRAVDLSAQLPAGLRQPPWVYRAAVISPPGRGTGARVELLGDHATGDISPAPLAACNLTAEQMPRWGFGECGFGAGGMGLDASGAPGLGRGAFGAGMFGVEAATVVLTAPLLEEGVHQLRCRLIDSTGQCTDGAVQHVTSHPPPAPPTSVLAATYDPQAFTLTLHIN